MGTLRLTIFLILYFKTRNAKEQAILQGNKTELGRGGDRCVKKTVVFVTDEQEVCKSGFWAV